MPTKVTKNKSMSVMMIWSKTIQDNLPYPTLNLPYSPTKLLSIFIWEFVFVISGFFLYFSKEKQNKNPKSHVKPTRIKIKKKFLSVISGFLDFSNEKKGEKRKKPEIELKISFNFYLGIFRLDFGFFWHFKEKTKNSKKANITRKFNTN